jgi:hypothetical protein
MSGLKGSTRSEVPQIDKAGHGLTTVRLRCYHGLRALHIKVVQKHEDSISTTMIIVKTQYSLLTPQATRTYALIFSPLYIVHIRTLSQNQLYQYTLTADGV